MSTSKTMLCLALVAVVSASGCTSFLSTHKPVGADAIPAHRLGPELKGPRRDEMVPVDFRLLRQQKPPAHVIGRGDVLGVYVRDVLENSVQLASVYFPTRPEDQLIQAPAVGHPVTVTQAGTLELPDVAPIVVEGKTIDQATAAIRTAYVDGGVIKPGQTSVAVNLIKPRTVKVIVLREDTGSPAAPTWKPNNAQKISRRGSADVLELAVGENDVLHALTESGGLPGIDGYNDVWILRGGGLDPQASLDVLQQRLASQEPSVELVRSLASSAPLVRIPLRVSPCAAVPFAPEDVILGEGDVLYVESRETEYFLTGGLLTGGMFPLPRDYDVDVFGAIAIANGNALGPAGLNAAATNFTIKPGSVIPPSRAIIVRTVGSRQIKIDVDLKRALDDPRERIVIQPRDLVLVKYRPAEFLGNLGLNLVTFNFFIPNGQ